MATYEKLVYDQPPFQEGNESDIVIELDSNFPIDQVSDITFQVRNFLGEALISDTMATGTVRLEEELSDGEVIQVVYVPVPAAATVGKPGLHAYEIDFKNRDGKPFATVGGVFPIDAQTNTL